MTIKASDMMDGAYSETLASGVRQVREERVFLVNELQSYAPHARKGAAANHPGIPLIGELHPTTANIICLEKIVEDLGDTDAFKVRCVYAFPATGGEAIMMENSPPEIRIGGTLVNKSTALDIDGVPIVIPQWTRFVDNEEQQSTDEQKLPEQGVKFDVQIPLGVLQIRRMENRNPFDAWRFFWGTINRTPLFIGDRPHTWLITRLEGTTADGGVTYTTEYEFQFNPDGWDGVAVYVDPDTGQPAAGASLSGGGVIDGVRLYRETEFRELGIAF